jgi:hypothetical protein
LERLIYSVKHKQHAVNVLLVVTLRGRIVYVSDINLRTHDQQHINNTDILQKVADAGVGMLADAGFTLNAKGQSFEVLGATPFRKPRRPPCVWSLLSA